MPLFFLCIKLQVLGSLFERVKYFSLEEINSSKMSIWVTIAPVEKQAKVVLFKDSRDHLGLVCPSLTLEALSAECD